MKKFSIALMTAAVAMFAAPPKIEASCWKCVVNREYPWPGGDRCAQVAQGEAGRTLCAALGSCIEHNGPNGECTKFKVYGCGPAQGGICVG